ncbi:hybrid sensor histidine kinase/response regulator [Winogradskyella sp. UBA3174]|uniref:hybrid sensor histidine kinase/response regulator n=1 Tax=Winogradskyella sp. UBA3174 TaxID=1947785 RepID=UPI0025E8EC95|nr:response regulator [Winogradskyella sp. UBA3174]
MSNYKNAEIYHLKALDIYDAFEDSEGKNRVLSSLIYNYLSEKNYTKFDSIYTKAQQISKLLNSELYFVNLENKIKKYYYKSQNDSLLKITRFAIDTLNSLDFKNLSFSDDYSKKNLRHKLLQSYKFYNAIANIKFANYKAEGFNLLFKLNEDELKEAFEGDLDSYRKLATFNYYKYRYFNEANKNVDSANSYLLKSDSYKYTALSLYENRNSRNGELIYKIINTEQKLNLANEIRKKDAKASQLFLITTILTSILLFATLIVFYFYFKAKRNIQLMNKELKTSNEKLVEIDKDRLEFFSILSHELRTPIYGITGLATLVNQEKDESKRQSYLDSLISSSNYLSILIDNILQANKLRFEEKSLRLKPDKICKIVNHVISTVKIAAKNKGLELKTNIDASDENELILIDKVAFSQILINLAYNAIRYTKEGHVTLLVIEKTRTTKDVTLRFEINDTGIGIKEEHRPVVFSAFENKAFLHKNSSGSGLGLHIVKTLLKSHNSDIDFISQTNKGTSFFFEITFDIVHSLNFKESVPISGSRPEMHILIVDDNKINLLITKKNIEKIDGCTCEVMSNGKEAISMIKNKAFDLVLMDINMPDMDGYEVTRHVRMFNSTIPILALTALNSSEISIKAEGVGINQIITKPYIFEDFKAIVLSYDTKRERYLDKIDLEAI